METKAALQKAKDALITDAKVYGESVALKPIVNFHVGDPVPVVKIANPMAKDPTQSLITSAFLKMASSKLDTIPEGTEADWADAKKVANDIKNVGNYTEDITVTFPDSSTTKLSAELSVLAAVKPGQKPAGKTDEGNTPVSKPEDSKSDQGKTDKGDTPVSKPEDSKSDKGDTPVDNSNDKSADQTSAGKNDHQAGNRDNDNVTPATATNNETTTPVTANNSASANVTTTSPVATTATPTFTTREQVRQTAQQLPQTGNHNNVAVAVLGAITGLFGFGLAAKRRERN